MSTLSTTLVAAGAAALMLVLAVPGCSDDEPPPPAFDAGSDAEVQAIDDSTCKTAGSLPACQSCCTEAHLVGSIVYDGAFLNCFCGPQGPCQEPCKESACAPNATNPDQTCRACIVATPACAPQIQAECAKDADCGLFQSCLQTCPQE